MAIRGVVAGQAFWRRPLPKIDAQTYQMYMQSQIGCLWQPGTLFTQYIGSLSAGRRLRKEYMTWQIRNRQKRLPVKRNAARLLTSPGEAG